MIPPVHCELCGTVKCLSMSKISSIVIRLETNTSSAVPFVPFLRSNGDLPNMSQSHLQTLEKEGLPLEVIERTFIHK